MAISPQQIDLIPDYTDAQLLKMYRKALIDISASGQSYAVEGQQLTHADLDKIRSAIDWLEGRLDNASVDSNPLGLVLARTARAT